MRMQTDTFSPEVAETAMVIQSFVTKVFGWMASALMVTTIIALVIAGTPSIAQAVIQNPGILWGSMIGTLVLVMILSWAINRISPLVAILLFFLYAAANGVVFSILFAVYTTGSIAATFGVTAGTFGVMAIYGLVTKRDLTSIGNLAFMMLIGVIIASVVNWFVQSEMLYWIVTYVGIAVFVGLTAYDTQKLKAMALGLRAGSDAERKGAIIGALALYLDFINLFLLLLRLFGRRR